MNQLIKAIAFAADNLVEQPGAPIQRESTARDSVDDELARIVLERLRDKSNAIEVDIDEI